MSTPRSTGAGTLQIGQSRRLHRHGVRVSALATRLICTNLTYSSGETVTWTENSSGTAGTLHIVDGATTENIALNGYYSTATSRW